MCESCFRTPRNRLSALILPFGLEIEHFSLCGKIDQMRAAIHGHVVEEFGLIEVTALSTRSTDPYEDLIFDKIGQMIFGTITGKQAS